MLLSGRLRTLASGWLTAGLEALFSHSFFLSDCFWAPVFKWLWSVLKSPDVRNTCSVRIVEYVQNGIGTRQVSGASVSYLYVYLCVCMYVGRSISLRVTVGVCLCVCVMWVCVWGGRCDCTNVQRALRFTWCYFVSVYTYTRAHHRLFT